MSDGMVRKWVRIKTTIHGMATFIITQKSEISRAEIVCLNFTFLGDDECRNI
jgi:hypothetical protein